MFCFCYITSSQWIEFINLSIFFKAVSPAMGQSYTLSLGQGNRVISQIPQCISQISHNAPFCNRNVHTGAHFCYKMVNCGIWDWCIVGFVQQVYCMIAPMPVKWPVKYPTMHHFVTEMCTQVHISVTKWWIVGYETGALWDLCDRSIICLPQCQ